MAGHLLLNATRGASCKSAVLNKIHLPAIVASQNYGGRSRIGKREVVGYGVNGEYSYLDRMDYPFPAIRFRAEDSNYAKLREKEKGDWKKLTIEDKKQLYRFSFCRTYAEMGAPTGEWKSILAGTLTIVSFAVWFYLGVKTFVYGPLPVSTSEEAKRKQLEMMIAYRMNPVEGVSSKWDYEKNQWKE